MRGSMPETITGPAAAFTRVSPLAGVAVPGRHGADKGAPGVTLSVRHPLSIVAVIARKGKAAALGASLAALDGVTVHWAGADQYHALAEGRREGELLAQLKDRLGDLASLSDQSHGRVVLRIEGPRARQVLAKGTPVDLHPDHFAVGQCAVTQMAHVGVHLARVGDDAYELSLFRGFAANFWEWLTEQAAEFGYQVG
jgi:heterotetrameric sarcosine oxidase gamma subunit